MDLWHTTFFPSTTCRKERLSWANWLAASAGLLDYRVVAIAWQAESELKKLAGGRNGGSLHG
jgi:hypothetical protein